MMMMIPCGATWPSQRIINSLHCQGNFRGGIEIVVVVGEEGGKGDREGSVVFLCPRAAPLLRSLAKSRFEERALFLSLSLSLSLSPCLAWPASEAGIGALCPTVLQAGNYFTQDPDFSVQGMSSTTSTQPSASSGGASTSADENARPPDSGANSSGPARSILSLQLDQRSLHFSVSAWVLIVALIGIFPLAPHALQYKGYRLSLLGTTCTTGYALFALYRLPRAGNLQAVQAWCHHVTSSKDFIPFMYCLMFATSKLHLKLVLVPVICWALEHVARFLRRHFTSSSLYRTYLEQPCTWVETNTTAVHFLRSNSEILLGFLLILSLFSRQRNVMQTFMYWQLLKLMYHSPFTAAYHRAIWLKIGRTINPYIQHYTPFLHDPINAGMRWWFR